MKGPTHHADAGSLDLRVSLYRPDDESQSSSVICRPYRRYSIRRGGNLTGNARDLWVAGIKNIKDQRTNLDDIVEMARDEGERQN